MKRASSALVSVRSAAMAMAALSSLVAAATSNGQIDVEQLEQVAFKAAAASVSPSVVQIRTVGGLDRVDQQLIADGPATGLILSEDGYIVSSAVNFAQQPTSILVRLPDGGQRAAELVGRDSSRMLVLLKIDAEAPLPVATPAPLADIQVGQWAVAVGRTFQSDRTNISVGVVSALRRMQGRMIQTDANVSTANYGGPLVDLHGRVLGILVPMAPPGQGAAEADEMAGADFYDSGIGFAAPLESVLEVLPRWIEQGDLDRGLLGVGLKKGNPHVTEPVVTSVWPGSPADEAGWLPGDRVLAVGGVEVSSHTQLRFEISPRYAGDVVDIRLRRGADDDAQEINTAVTLAAKLPPYRHAFLGVLPMREAAQEDAPGLTLRSIWPETPAAEAGLQSGDRLTQIDDEKIATTDDAIALIRGKNPGDTAQLSATRGDQQLTFAVELTELAGDVLSTEQLASPAAEGGTDENTNAALGAPVEVTEVRLPETEQQCWLYDPSAGQSDGLILWLGASGKEFAAATANRWAAICRRDRLRLAIPSPADDQGWTNEDLRFLARVLMHLRKESSPGVGRVVVGGAGKAGQLACAFALRVRDGVDGVVTVGAPLPRTMTIPDNTPNKRLSILAVVDDQSPFTVLIRQDVQRLSSAGYPVAFSTRQPPDATDQELDDATRDLIGRWIDGLDRF